MKNLTILYIFFFIELAFCRTQIFAQTSRLICIPTRYSQKGVIFDSAYNVSLALKKNNYRFTPSISEIYLAEAVLNKPFSKTPNNLDNFYRQYLGYIDQENNKIIVVQLINSKIKKSEAIYIEPWKVEFLMGFGPFYESNVKLYYINITQNKLFYN